MAETNSHYVEVLVQQAPGLGLDVPALLVDAGMEPDEPGVPWIDNDHLGIQL